MPSGLRKTENGSLARLSAITLMHTLPLDSNAVYLLDDSWIFSGLTTVAVEMNLCMYINMESFNITYSYIQMYACVYIRICVLQISIHTIAL